MLDWVLIAMLILGVAHSKIRLSFWPRVLGATLMAADAVDGFHSDVTYASASRVNTGTACAYADAVHLLWILGADVGILGWSGSHCTPHAIRIGQLCGATSCLCLGWIG